MDMKEYQKLSKNIVDRIDKKHDLDRDVQMTISQLVEEFGELAKVANLKKLRAKNPELKDLEDEFADVLIQLAKLADILGVDLEKSVAGKIEVLKKRQNV